jgi:Contractile injection system tube protein
MALQKAFLRTKESGDELECAFNPKEITVSKSAQWKRTPNRRSRRSSTPEFVGTNPRSLKMALFFNTTGSRATGRGVADHIDLLFSWMSPTDESSSNNRPQPPLLTFHWGDMTYFEAYLKQMSAKYVLFTEQGVPIRAQVNVTFEETPDSAEAQNPTSGGRPGRRVHQVIAGETLPAIAYREYRQADRWRAIALENRIADPFRLQPGTELLIPPAVEAERLS